MENNLYYYKAVIRRVIDGDSISADIDLGFNVILRDQKIRLYGINAPEVVGVNKSAGLITKDRLKALIEGKEVILESYKDKTEKYGRWLGIIHYQNEVSITVNVNEQLVSEGLAVKYMI